MNPFHRRLDRLEAARAGFWSNRPLMVVASDTAALEAAIDAARALNLPGQRRRILGVCTGVPRANDLGDTDV